MYLSFTLGMPGVNTWNGGWSGDGQLFVIVKTFRKPPQVEGENIAPCSYTYNFGDGWCASVDAEVIDAKKARQLRRKSQGFCGYEWMVEEILEFGRIKTLQEHIRKESTKAEVGS